jgi:hypothetical protein
MSENENVTDAEAGTPTTPAAVDENVMVSDPVPDWPGIAQDPAAVEVKVNVSVPTPTIPTTPAPVEVKVNVSAPVEVRPIAAVADPE